MERIGQLEPRISVLEDDFDEEALEAEAGNAQAAAVSAWHFFWFHQTHAALYRHDASLPVQYIAEIRMWKGDLMPTLGCRRPQL